MATQLSVNQQKIIQSRSPYMVVQAQPGSGKTRVLVERFVRLLKAGTQPDQLVAITFTQKAADEMKQRIASLCDAPIETLWIMTIHGFCSRILSENAWEADPIGVPLQFSVLSAEESLFMRGNVVTDCLKKGRETKDAAVIELLNVYGFERTKELLLLMLQKTYLLEKMKSFSFPNPALKSVYGAVVRAYQSCKSRESQCDFDDLLLKAYQLLASRPHILKRYRHRFRLVCVDEFQDTDDIQKDILDLLTQPSKVTETTPQLMVVGDPKQSIYRFRGADVGLFEAVKQDVLQRQGFCFELVTNYRSEPKIIDFVNAVSEPLLGQHFIPLEVSESNASARGSVRCFSSDPDGDPISAFEGRLLEAQWMANIIKRYRKGSVAVLFRAMTYAHLYEKALKEAGIPVILSHGGMFYQHPAVEELLSLLRWVLDPKDEFSLWRVLSAPWSPFPEKNIFKVASERAKKKGELFPSLDQKTRFFLQKLKWQKERTSLLEWYQKVLFSQGGALTGEVRMFMDCLRQFEWQRRSCRWHEFLTYIDALKEASVKVSETVTHVASDAVCLLTVHQAKGLEFDNLFLPDLSYMPRIPSPLMLVDKKSGIGLKVPTRRQKWLEDDIYKEIKKKEKEADLEESKRLLYVAMTRAKKHLILSYASLKPRKQSWASFVGPYVKQEYFS